MLAADVDAGAKRIRMLKPRPSLCGLSLELRVQPGHLCEHRRLLSLKLGLEQPPLLLHLLVRLLCGHRSCRRVPADGGAEGGLPTPLGASGEGEGEGPQPCRLRKRKKKEEKE